MIKTASAGNFLISGNFGCEACWNLTSRRTRRAGSPDWGGNGAVRTDQKAAQGPSLLGQTDLCGNPASLSLSFFIGKMGMIISTSQECYDSEVR